MSRNTAQRDCPRCCGSSRPTAGGSDDPFFLDRGSDLTEFEFLTLIADRAGADQVGEGIDWRAFITPEVLIKILTVAAVVLGFDSSKIPGGVAQIQRVIQGGSP